jgi:hypothetical protein
MTKQLQRRTSKRDVRLAYQNEDFLDAMRRDRSVSSRSTSGRSRHSNGSVSKTLSYFSVPHGYARMGISEGMRMRRNLLVL